MKLNEAKRILKNAGYLVENEKRTNEIASIVSDVLDLKKLSQQAIKVESII